MVKKFPTAVRQADPPENLHIAAIQRIVGKHRNNFFMPLRDVKYWIDRAATDTGGTMESKDLERIREQLQRDLGLDINQVLDLVKRWPA